MYLFGNVFACLHIHLEDHRAFPFPGGLHRLFNKKRKGGTVNAVCTKATVQEAWMPESLRTWTAILRGSPEGATTGV